MAWKFALRRRLRFGRHTVPISMVLMIIAVILTMIIFTVKAKSGKVVVASKPTEVKPTAAPVYRQIEVPENEFISHLRSVLIEQYNLFQKNCPASDVWRPKTRLCKNITLTSETSLASLASFLLLDKEHKPDIFQQVPSFAGRTGLEIGHIADYVIAPLISAYHVSHVTSYLDKAVAIGNELLQFFKETLPHPFIGYQEGHFGKQEIFIDSVSSIYPVFAALKDLTDDGAFLTPIRKFLDILKKSIHKNQIPTKYKLRGDFRGSHSAVLDIPFRVYADVARVGRILPDLRLDVDDLLDLVFPLLTKSNPVMVYNVTDIFVYNIDACTVGGYISRNHQLYSQISKKCRSLIKRVPLPKRITGQSEFGPIEFHSGFAFEGELLEVMWRDGKIDKAREFINTGLTETRFDNVITGMLNRTTGYKRSDNVMHPELYSRWLLNAVLIESNISYDSVVLSDKGNILKM